MDSGNPVVSISNDSDFDVEIFDVYNSTGQTDGLLTYTSLGAIKSGAQLDVHTLRFASQLQAMCTGRLAALGDLSYYQFPVMVMAVSKLRATPGFTITNDEMDAMVQAFKFVKYVSANPDSKIAKGFVTALSDSQNQETSVDAFFAGTASFNKVTLPRWTAVMSWQTQFLSPWQGTYYLYNNADGEAAAPIRLVAVVGITGDQNSGTLSVADANGNVSTASQKVGLAMAGDGTMSEQNVGTDALSVSLRPVWMNVMSTGSDGTITYRIGSALGGTLDGNAVTGTGEKRTLPDASTKSPDSKAAAQNQESQIWSRISGIVSTLISAGMLFIMFKQWKEGHGQKRNDAENKAADDPARTEADVQHDQEQADTDYQKNLDHEIESGKIQEVEDAADELPQLQQELTTDIKVQSRMAQVDEQVDKLGEVLETEAPTQAIEDTAEQLAEIQSDLQSGNVDGVDAKLDAVNTQIDNQLSEGGDRLQGYEQKALEDVKADMEASAAQEKAVDDALEEHRSEVEENDGSSEVSEENFEPVEEPVEVEFAR